jgi:hypothetical protein
MRKLVAFILVQLFLAIALWSSPSCKRIPDPGTIATIVIDCTVEALKPKIDELAETLRPLLSLQRPKTAEAFAIAKQAGKEIGGCAFARIAQEIMSNRGAPPDTEAGFAISTALDRFRVEVVGNGDAAFETIIDGRKVRL